MSDFTIPTIFGTPPPGPESIERDGRRYVREWPVSKEEPKVPYIDRMAAEGSLEKVFVGSAPRFRNSDIDRIVESGL